MKILSGLTVIGIATVLSFVIANIPTEVEPGLGGFINLLWPMFLGICSMVAYLIISVVIKSRKGRLLTSVVIAAYLIYVGLGLYLDKGWPLVY